MSKILQFGEEVEGYQVRVLNEREIRAAAGLLFVLMFLSIFLAAVKQDFLLLKYAITIFLTDILIRILINPKFSPTLILGRLIVGKQDPEYVGAAPKKLAWIIGAILGLTMFILMVVVNSYSPITGIICLICLIFLFFETSFGICLGCKFYSLFYKEQPILCPGGVCEVKPKQDIQKTSWIQVLIVFGFVLFIILEVMLFNGILKEKPFNLFGEQNTEQVKENN